MKKGLFITFEGPDGSGKTTISSRVQQVLNKEGYKTIYTREPGGSRIAEEIRDLILNPVNIEMDVKTEALLYAASRRQHLVERILPNLEMGHHVISDRFVDSSLVYQGVGRNIGIDAVWQINKFALDGHFPDLTVYLDISAAEGLARISNRTFKDRLDQEDIAFHEKVHGGYELIKEQFKDRIVVFDARLSIEQLTNDISEYLMKWIDSVEDR